MSSKFKASLIILGLILTVGLITGVFFWRQQSFESIDYKAKVVNCQWQNVGQKLKWQCQVSNSGLATWSKLKFQIANWEGNNTWKKITEIETKNLGWGDKQSFSGELNLNEKVWRLRAAVITADGKVAGQDDWIWAQLINQNQTWLKNFLKNKADWLVNTTSTDDLPKVGCSQKKCWQSCLLGLNLTMPVDCKNGDIECSNYWQTWSQSARLCETTCQSQACSFCSSDPCGQALAAPQIFCGERDLFQLSRQYQCQPAAGASNKVGVCVLNEKEEKIQSCGETKYGEWGEPYCRGKLLLRQRTIQEPYCLSGKCLSAPAVDEELIKKCEIDCIDAACVGNSKPIVDAGPDQNLNADEVKKPVYFLGVASDTDGKIVLYEWDFNGDGKVDFSSKENGNSQFIYGKSGNYTARLRVTDDNNNQAIGETKISFLENKNISSTQSLDGKKSEINFKSLGIWKILIIVLGGGILIYFITRL